ncbi:MAG: ribonuclease HII [Thermoplasmataceae archaeon]|jgi:ribonuclease HII
MQIQCGLDEAGRGPVIGPMVVAIVCCDPLQIKEIGVRDSKKLTPERRSYLFDRIMETSICVEIETIPSTVINGEMQYRTLNEIEYDRFLSLIRKCGKDAYVDAFDVDPERLSRRLSTDSGFKIIAEHGADDRYPSVSAASIIAKVTRDREIGNLHEIYGDFGSGYPSDPATVKFLKQSLQNGINIEDIVRKEWKTWKDLTSGKKQKFLFPNDSNIK